MKAVTKRGKQGRYLLRDIDRGHGPQSDIVHQQVQSGADAAVEAAAGADQALSIVRGELRAGPVYRRVNAQVDTGSPVLPALSETSAGINLRLPVISKQTYRFLLRSRQSIC